MKNITNTVIFDMMFGQNIVHHDTMNEFEVGIINRIENLLIETEKINSYISSLPEVFSELMVELESEKTDFLKIEALLNKDPILASKLLSLANSAYYKHTKKPIETLAKAIAVLGLDNINCIVIPLLVKGIFRVNLYHFKLFGSLIWQHSLETAVLCKMLSKDADNISQFHCYLMGLVHDLGKVVVFECISQQLNEIDSFSFLGSNQFKQALAKHSLLLSVEISKNWQLPIKIQDSLEQQVKGDEDVFSHILSLANKISEANLLIENNKLTLVSAIEEISNENISEDQVTSCLNKLMELPPL